MFYRVCFERSSEDGLSGASWTFFLLRDTLVVDAYEEFERSTKRHKPKVLRGWYRLDPRVSSLKKHEVPLTPEVEQQAKAEFMRQLEYRLTVGFQQ